MVQPREPSALREAKKLFVELADSTYANKQLGLSGQLEVMACDCDAHAGEDGEVDENGEPIVCGPDSNCINRMTYMECYGDHCGCDAKRCANRRFQNHQHAKIDVFRAGAKGFGVRAKEPIRKGDFIYEYTGEVLDEQRFQKRQVKYQKDQIKHFYFMMLQKDEFIDATEKGSLARFCNHSCNPNAAIEKWVVGPKIRMGLFAKRDIAKDEEICFDYKVDRYGSRAQICLCGAPNCSGFLGGRTQTGGALLPPSVIEGLGLDLESALGWHEKSSQRLREKIPADLLGSDLESVLRISKKKAKQGNDASRTADRSPSRTASPPQSGLEPRAAPRAEEEPMASGPPNPSGSPAETPQNAQPLSPGDQPDGPSADRQSSQLPSQSNGQPLSQANSQLEPPQNGQLEPPQNGQRELPPNDRSEDRSEDLLPPKRVAKNLTERPQGDLVADQPRSPLPADEEGPATPSIASEASRNGAGLEPKQSRKKAKQVDLLALLDAPSSLLNDLQKQARQYLIETLPVKELTIEDLPEFMRILMHTQDGGWLINRMLQRILKTEEPRIQNSILNMHGYEIIGTVLNRWQDNDEVVMSGLEVLQKWPKVTRNKISSSKIEAIVTDLQLAHQQTEIGVVAKQLLDEWSNLAMGYRIPRRKLSDNEKAQNNSQDGSPRSTIAPTELDEEIRNEDHRIDAKTETALPDRPPKRPRSLPPGWEAHQGEDGRTVYYNRKTQMTSWKFPDPREIEREAKRYKREQEQERLRLEVLQKERERQANEIQRIINSANSAEKAASPENPSATTTPSKSHRYMGSRGTPVNSPGGGTTAAASGSLHRTLAGYVPKLVIHREAELGRERCKRHAREIVHILVSKEEAKNKNLDDYELTPERKKKIKSFVKAYMDKVCSHHSKSAKATATPN